MKRIIHLSLLALLLTMSVIISSCNKDSNPVTNPTSNTGSITGGWYVDQIQMVTAPTNGTLSALMKASLVPFGLVSASTIGATNVKFGLEKWLQYNAGTNSLLHIQFLNQQTGWISDSYNGSSAGIYSTVNGGVSWGTKKTVSSYAYVDCFQFFDENTGFAAARNTSTTNAVLKTTNGGINWTSKYSGSTSYPAKGMYFVDTLTGYLLRDNQLQKTTNGGINWTTVVTSFSNATKLQFTDNQNGLFLSSGGGAKLTKTTDGGNSWITINCPNFAGDMEFSFLNSTTGWVRALDNSFQYGLCKTTDGGVTWLKVNSNYFYKIMFTDNSNGFAITANNTISQTNDGGNTWQFQTSLSSYQRELLAFDASKCYTIGDNGSFFTKSNVIDTAVWTLSGKITNTAIQLITKSGDKDYNATGVYSLLNNNIVFVIQDYSGGMGNINSGSGTYSFGGNTFNITLNLANSEKWLIVLKR